MAVTLDDPTATHDIEGGGGLKLHAHEWGNRTGRSIVFIHGWSQSQLCWARQVQGPLAEQFHLVTFDTRGHGMSEKPLAADRYADSRLWADDLAAIITHTCRDRPVLVGWSYGGLVIADYVRAHGEAAIAAINLVGGVVKLEPPAFEHIGPGFLENVAGACAPDLGANIAAIERFVGALSAAALGDGEREALLCWNMVVPALVRAACVAREIDSDDVLAGLSVPVLVSHGRDDTMALPSTVEHVLAQCRTAQASWYDGAGHMPFLECPERFNGELAAFARRVPR